MKQTQLKQLAAAIANGYFRQADVKRLEKLSLTKLVAQLATLSPHQFLDMHLKQMCEVGFAKSYRSIIVKRLGMPRRITHVFKDCIIVTSDRDIVTDMTYISEIRCRRSRDHKHTYELSSGSGTGFSIGPDGFALAARKPASISLSDAFLKKRGWDLSVA